MHKILPQLNVFRSLSADNCTFCPRNAGLIVLVNESRAILRETEAKKKSAQVNHFLNQGGSSDKLGLSRSILGYQGLLRTKLVSAEGGHRHFASPVPVAPFCRSSLPKRRSGVVIGHPPTQALRVGRKSTLLVRTVPSIFRAATFY